MACLELGVQVFFQHTLAMGFDIQAFFRHLGDFVLALRNHHRHIRLTHIPHFGFQFRAVQFIAGFQLGLQSGLLYLPMFAHPVVHADRGGFINGDDHRFAVKTTSHEVQDDILGDFLQAVIAGDEMIFT